MFSAAGTAARAPGSFPQGPKHCRGGFPSGALWLGPRGSSVLPSRNHSRIPSPVVNPAFRPPPCVLGCITIIGGCGYHAGLTPSGPAVALEAAEEACSATSAPRKTSPSGSGDSPASPASAALSSAPRGVCGSRSQSCGLLPSPPPPRPDRPVTSPAAPGTARQRRADLGFFPVRSERLSGPRLSGRRRSVLRLCDFCPRPSPAGTGLLSLPAPRSPWPCPLLKRPLNAGDRGPPRGHAGLSPEDGSLSGTHLPRARVTGQTAGTAPESRGAVLSIPFRSRQV